MTMSMRNLKSELLSAWEDSQKIIEAKDAEIKTLQADKAALYEGVTKTQEDVKRRDEVINQIKGALQDAERSMNERDQQLTDAHDRITDLESDISKLPKIEYRYPVWDFLRKMFNGNAFVVLIWAVIIVIVLSQVYKHNIGPGPTPGPTPPIPGPGPEPAPNVIQLDKTEYAIYQSAIAQVQSITNVEDQKQALQMLLGPLPMKVRIIEAFPNEKIEVLQ